MINGVEGKKKAVCITGTGAYLPERILTNEELEKMVDTSDEWIKTRTGISERHLAGDHEAVSDMAASASVSALESAGITALDVDVIVVATCTPDMPLPNSACFVQNMIGAKNAFCLDIEAACSGFVYGLEIVRGWIESGIYKTALVIGAEKLSCVVDWEDRGTCVLFGDGAGAVVVQAREECEGGILASQLGSDGALTSLLSIPGGGSRTPISKRVLDEKLYCLKMEGNQVFKHAVRCMADAGINAVERAGLDVTDIDWVIPHQANMRIIQAIADKVGISMDKFVVNLDKVGNMSAASIPVALDEAVKDGRVRKGDVLLFIVFGGGFTWGATVVKWV